MTDSSPLSFIQALFLGIVQGITEFLPISSSGHLAFFEALFGSKEDSLVFFNVLCHAGTLLAVLIVLRKDWIALFKSKKECLLLSAALLPLIPLFPLLKPIKALFSRPELLFFFFLITAFFLFIGSLNFSKERKKSYSSACFVGLCQAFALMPGISRSGATISGARIAGWSFQEALKFSFLLSIPTILGGLLLESMAAIKEPFYGEPLNYLGAFIASFLSGFIALKWILKRLHAKQLRFFSIYCFFLSLICLFLFSI